MSISINSLMALAIPQEFARKKTSKVKCPNCKYEFNFIHSKYGSITAVRIGSVWIFKCPKCNQKQRFDLKDHEYDSTLPTYVDPGPGRLFMKITPPIIGPVISIVVLELFLPPNYKALALTPQIPFIVAVVWLTLLVIRTTRIHMWTPH